MTRHDRVAKHLKKTGWARYTGEYCKRIGCCEYWCKRFKALPGCACNDDKIGIQIAIFSYKRDDLKYGKHGYEIELCAQKQDGVWIKWQMYSINEDEILRVMDNQIIQLICAWQHVAWHKGGK